MKTFRELVPCSDRVIYYNLDDDRGVELGILDITNLQHSIGFIFTLDDYAQNTLSFPERLADEEIMAIVGLAGKFRMQNSHEPPSDRAQWPAFWKDLHTRRLEYIRRNYVYYIAQERECHEAQKVLSGQELKERYQEIREFYGKYIQ